MKKVALFLFSFSLLILICQCSSFQREIDVEDSNTWVIKAANLNKAREIAERNNLFLDEERLKNLEGIFVLKSFSLDQKREGRKKQIDLISQSLQSDLDVLRSFGNLKIYPIDRDPVKVSKIEMKEKRNQAERSQFTDPLYLDQYHHFLLDTPGAWAQNVTGKNVHILVTSDG